MRSSGDPRERCVIYRGARYKKPDGVIAPTRTHAIVILEASSLPIKIRFGTTSRDPGFGVDDETGSKAAILEKYKEESETRRNFI